MKWMLRLAFLFFSFVAPVVGHATHYLGGELTYEYLGGSSYKIKARLYRDCLHGEQQAIQQDAPVRVTVFQADGTVYMKLILNTARTTYLPVVRATGSCHSDTARWCANYLDAEAVATLAPNAAGYYAVYDRCCMVHDVTNVFRSDETGLRLKVFIAPPAMGGGRPPEFNQPAMLRACSGIRFALDCSAKDLTADSLVYTLAGFESSDASTFEPLPQPSSFEKPEAALWMAGYTAREPFGTGAPVSLDSSSGFLAGTVYRPGRYLVPVQVFEWRDGLRLPSIRRTFVLEVADCGPITKAGVEPDSLLQVLGLTDRSINRCGGQRRVSFRNSSRNSSAYRWDFGVPGMDHDTSTEEMPTFDYPAAGRYPLTLVAYNGACIDTFRSWVVLSDDPAPAVDFSLEVPAVLCAGTRAILRDETNGSLRFTDGWQLGEGGRFLSDPKAREAACSWETSGKKEVLHWVETAGGCVAMTSKEVSVASGGIVAGPDTVVVQGTPLELLASRGSAFHWTALGSAVFASGKNYDSGSVVRPITTLPAGNYAFVVSGIGENGCPGTDTASVTLAVAGYLFVPGAFSPNGDGTNDVLLPRTAGVTLREFVVFNRSGRRVFQTSDFRQGWDGRMDGADAPVDVYFWMIRATDESGGAVLRSGDVTLIR